jgi:hypothetical protein
LKKSETIRNHISNQIQRFVSNQQEEMMRVRKLSFPVTAQTTQRSNMQQKVGIYRDESTSIFRNLLKN